MPRWQDVVGMVPDLAAVVEERFTAHRHHTMATLRRDGSPRISGTEVVFADGDVLIGSMPGAVKARDLLRDPRIALHSHSEDPDDDDPAAWSGDAKLSGRAVRVDRAGAAGGDALGAEWFRLEVAEIVTTVVGSTGEHLVITHWRPGMLEIHHR